MQAARDVAGRVATSPCRTPDRPRPGGRSRRGGPGSGGSARSRGRARGASSRRTARGRGSRSSTRGRRARPPSASGASDRDRSAPRSGRRPPRPRPRTRARYVFFTRRALSWAISECCAASCFATISRPLVSRSRRWTMPGRWTPAMPPNSAALAAGQQGVDERAAGVARRGMDDEARPACRRSGGRRPRRRSEPRSPAPARGRAARPPGRRAGAAVPGPIDGVRLERQPVGRQVTGRDELLDVAPRQAGHVGEEAVDALRSGVVGDRQDARPGRRRRVTSARGTPRSGIAVRPAIGASARPARRVATSDGRSAADDQEQDREADRRVGDVERVPAESPMPASTKSTT